MREAEDGLGFIIMITGHMDRSHELEINFKEFKDWGLFAISSCDAISSEGGKLLPYQQPLRSTLYPTLSAQVKLILA